MTDLVLDDPRRRFLESEGHLLLTGGPGSGKTTIALVKAHDLLSRLDSEQKVLFLSFSRAAVRQIVDRMQGIFDREGRRSLEVRTFHSFFLELTTSHGELLSGMRPSVITPDRERQLRANFDGDWKREVDRLADTEGRYVFGKLAAAAASLLERSSRLRSLYGNTYPVIIVDEFQDTSNDQWRAIRSLAEVSAVVCLADPDQRIFDYVHDIDERRIEHLIEELHPCHIDLSEDNYRSPDGGILRFATAVLHFAKVETSASVAIRTYGWEMNCEEAVHRLVLRLTDHLQKQLGRRPAIAVLTTTNALAARLSEGLARPREIASGTLPLVEHELLWDAELAAAAGYVVASILNWPEMPRSDAISATLSTIADYYRSKAGDDRGKTAKAVADKIERSGDSFRLAGQVRSKTATRIIEAYDRGIEFIGEPVSDWQRARSILSGTNELDEMFAKVRLLRLLRATDSLAWALAGAWDGVGAYRNAVVAVREVLVSEMIAGPGTEPSPISLMNMHKSKGKEFDGVLIAEDKFSSRLLDPQWEPDRLEAQRRLLRVAITRARHMVVIVRPPNCEPLVPT